MNLRFEGSLETSSSSNRPVICRLVSETTATYYDGQSTHFDRLRSFKVPVNASDILVFCTEIMKELFSRFAGVWLDFIRRASSRSRNIGRTMTLAILLNDDNCDFASLMVSRKRTFGALLSAILDFGTDKSQRKISKPYDSLSPCSPGYLGSLTR